MNNKSEDKSCESCSHCVTPNRWGCPWRTEIAMFEDKSPCLNWWDGAEQHTNTAVKECEHDYHTYKQCIRCNDMKEVGECEHNWNPEMLITYGYKWCMKCNYMDKHTVSVPARKISCEEIDRIIINTDKEREGRIHVVDRGIISKAIVDYLNGENPPK